MDSLFISSALLYLDRGHRTLYYKKIDLYICMIRSAEWSFVSVSPLTISSQVQLPFSGKILILCPPYPTISFIIQRNTSGSLIKFHFRPNLMYETNLIHVHETQALVTADLTCYPVLCGNWLVNKFNQYFFYFSSLSYSDITPGCDNKCSKLPLVQLEPDQYKGESNELYYCVSKILT